MKTSLIQIFDKEAEAKKAFGAASTAFPDNRHELVKSSNLIKVRAKVNNTTATSTYGTEETVTFVVLSIAPD